MKILSSVSALADRLHSKAAPITTRNLTLITVVAVFFVGGLTQLLNIPASYRVLGITIVMLFAVIIVTGKVILLSTRDPLLEVSKGVDPALLTFPDENYKAKGECGITCFLSSVDLTMLVSSILFTLSVC